MPATLQDLAREAFEQFERRTIEGRDPESFYALRDGRPEWVFDLVYAAHDDGDYLPDDWRYDAIHSALAHIIDDADEDADMDDDEAHEFADGNVDTYNGARFAWLASHLNRQFYCDEAAEEYGEPDGITDRIALGQYAESREVFEQVVTALRERLDEIAGEEDEDGDDG